MDINDKPFAAPIIKSLIEEWLERTNFIITPANKYVEVANKDYPFTDDSWGWAVIQMKEILEDIK